MKFSWNITSSLVIFLALSSCNGGKGGSKKSDVQATDKDATSAITYAGYMKAWLDKNCVSCHGEDGEAPDLSTYEGAKASAEKILAAVQDKKNPMPPKGPKVGADVIAKIKEWIKAGKPKGSAGKNSKDKAPEKDTEGGAGASLTWDGWVSNWTQVNCISCHGQGGSEPDLSSYEAVKENIDAVIASIQDEENPMPKGGTKPGKDVVTKLKDWKKAGMPEGESGSSDDDSNTATSTDTGSDDQGDGDDDTDGDAGGDTGAALTYDGWTRGWLADNCVGCHKAGATPPDLSTYELAKANVDAILESIQNEENPMPKGGQLPGADIVAKVQAWKDNGLLKGSAATITSTKTSTSTKTGTGTTTKTSTRTGTSTATGTGTATSTAVTYDANVKAYLVQRCTVCHEPGDTAPDLTTYQGAQAQAQRILARVAGGDARGIMPPAAQPAPAATLDMLRAWIAQGSKER